MYWPNRVNVNMEHNIKFKCNHILTLEPPAPVDPPLVTPTATTPGTTGSEVEPELIEPLKGL